MKSFLIFIILLFGIASEAQQTANIDFKRAEVDIFNIDPLKGIIEGRMDLHFEVQSDVDSVYVDAKELTDMLVTLDQKEVNISEYDGLHIVVKKDFKANSTHTLHIKWKASPKKAMYFVGWNNKGPDQIWTQGQGKYTSHWMPSIDDMNDKIEFDISILFDNNYSVIANGKLINKEIGEEKTLWQYDMNAPMSSYLVALAIGKYAKKEVYSRSGIPLEMYYYPEDSLKFEPTYRHSLYMFDFFEAEIGVPYPWQNYKQIPVHDFLHAGMENTSATFFSDALVVDSIGFNDNNYVNINAHELAHQWFGDLITETSGTHHWLHEGFATYYALLAEKQVFGANYFYWRLYEYAQQLEIQDLSNESTALLDPGSSSLTFYQKGAWTLFMLRELVGDVVFKQAVQKYLNTFKFENVSTPDFLGFVEELSEIDLTNFAYEWLRNTDFPFERAMDALKQNSSFIEEYLMVDCEVKSSKCQKYLNSGISDEAKSKLIAQMPDNITSELFNSNLKIRQAIAINLKKIPLHLKTEYESLLDDASYTTIENALFNLWNNFPEERIKYLTKTKDIIGFSNKNVRLLWLLLANITPEYDSDSSVKFKDELLNYTSSRYNFEIRIMAFQYLDMLKSCSDKCLINLEEAKMHYNWQMSKFAKDMLSKLKE